MRRLFRILFFHFRDIGNDEFTFSDGCTGIAELDSPHLYRDKMPDTSKVVITVDKRHFDQPN